MKRLALYGYGRYGKRTSESFRLYWGGEYTVTAIFDRNPAGKTDEFWQLPVLGQERIEEEYKKGTFEALMICIYDGKERLPIENRARELGIPVFFPGREEDIAGPEAFDEDLSPGITISRDHYSFHVYRNMMGAVGDFEREYAVFLFNEEGRVNIDNYRKYREVDLHALLLSYPFRLRNPIPERIIMGGDYCLLTKSYAFNYWHFTCEAADCVYLLEKAGFKGKYIFRDMPFAREVLSLLGVAPERLIPTSELKLHTVYVFERLFTLNQTGFGYLQCPTEILPEMGDYVQRKLTRDLSSPKKIYIRRIGVRKLLNGEETAKRNGFQIVVPEEYSVREQMNLFYNADIVLSPHGANSANCLYMRKGTVLAEIFSDRWHMDINERICRACGVKYLELVGKATEEGPKNRDADYTVDEEALQDLIIRAQESFAKGRVQ